LPRPPVGGFESCSPHKPESLSIKAERPFYPSNRTLLSL